MLAKDAGNSLLLINDSPFFKVNIDKCKVSTIYDGQFLKIKKERDLTKDDERLLRRQHIRADIPETWESLYMPEMEKNADVFKKLRELLLVYRISRKRRQAYECVFQNMDHMDASLPVYGALTD